MVEGINNFSKDEYALSYSDFKNLENNDNESTDISIFDSEANNSENVSETNIEMLNSQLESVQNEQGCISKAWNGIKDVTGLGVSNNDCEDAIESYKKGDITYEEAEAKIEEYRTKQESSLNLFSNIATSITAIAAATAAGAAIIASGGTAAIPMLAAVGAGTGAATKIGFKMTDRATNEVEGDAIDAKQIVKDGLSGAVTGGIAAATMGTGSSSSSFGSSVVKSGLNSAKTGAITGGISGAANYSIDCVVDEEKDFEISEMASSALKNAACTAVVGAAIGSVNGGLRFTGMLSSGGMISNNAGTIANTATKDIAANSACSSAYKICNDRIKSALS